MAILKRLDIIFTTTCNFHCANCLAYCRQQDEHILYDIDKFIEPLKYLQTYATIQRLQVYGGEATLFPEYLIKLLKKLRDVLSKDTILELLTNGWWMPNEDKFGYIWNLIDKLGMGVHPELLNRFSIDDIRECMCRVRQKYNIITDLYLDSTFAIAGFTDIPYRQPENICRFDRCTTLLPSAELTKCGLAYNIPEKLASITFNKLRKNSHFNIYKGTSDSLQDWLTNIPECCQYCTGDDIRIPHFGYDREPLQELIKP